MKKPFLLILALIMILSLTACGGGKAAPTSANPEPSAAPKQAEELEFTPQQQALAANFLNMAKEFDAIVDRVNAIPELLENEEFVASMNELADEIIKADDYFANPETLTPEVIGALSVAIELGNSFIAEANTALDEAET